VGVAFDEYVVKASLEEMPFVAVPPVEPPRVHAVQPVHSAGDIRLRRLNEEVIVIRHQAIRMASPIEDLDDLLEQLEETEPVTVIDEDLLLAVPAGRHVVGSAGSLESGRAGHLPTVAAARLALRAWHSLGAETARFRLSGTGPGARHGDTSRRGTA